MKNAGHLIQVRRSSRIRQQSFPKTTDTTPIDLVDSDNENEMSTGPTQQSNDRVRVYPLSNNRVKITAGRPTSIVCFTLLTCYFFYFLYVLKDTFAA